MSEYPRMLFHEDGSTFVAKNATEERQAPEGFGRDPHPVHHESVGIASGRAVAVPGQAGTVVASPTSRLEPELLPAPRRRGRPPGSANIEEEA